MKLNEVKQHDNALYTTQEVADFMGVPYMQVYRLVKSGKIKAVNTAPDGSKKQIWKIRAEDVQAYYDSLSNPTDRSEGIHE